MADQTNWNLGLTPDFSEGFRYQEAGQANRARQAETERRDASRTALTAYANKAPGALQQLNQVDPAMGMQLQQQEQSQAAAEAERERLKQERGFRSKISLADALVHAPKGEARMRIFDGLAPVLPDVDEAVLDQIKPYLDDDEFLRALSGKYDQELKFFNTGNGNVVGLDPRTGREVTAYQAPRDPLDDQYRQAQIQATQARAGASSRSNTGAGRGRSGGAMKLPTGFILD